MREPAFDIFLGESEKDAIWLEKVEGLSNAKARMKKFARENPGHYFVCSENHSILARTNTYNQPESLKDSSATAS
ncbi:MAG TPA: hypothetical protein VNY97_01830 [Candidatus Angelobacter sp.]|jgi:hypothetical protein|nr:hypothetical protein [Candidatus Angelobacter sp.]